MLLLEGISQLYKFKLIVQNVISPGWVPKYVNGGGGRNSRFVEIYKESSLPKIFPPLVLHNYSSMYTVFVENTGHSIKIDLRSDDEECEQGDLPAISGSLLQGRYILKNVHFHWEADHVINGRMFPLEGHFVHLPENPDSGDTSVVLSVFYEVSKCANPTFDIICDGVDQVSKEVECPVESKKAIALQGLLPKRISSYFTYENSDGEEIIFIIMATPAKISKRQLVGITSICDENGEPVISNNRANSGSGEGAPCDPAPGTPEVYYNCGWLEAMKLQIIEKIWKRADT